MTAFGIARLFTGYTLLDFRYQRFADPTHNQANPAQLNNGVRGVSIELRECLQPF